MKIIVRTIFILVFVVIASVIGLLTYSTLTDYNPPLKETISEIESAKPIDKKKLQIMIWNVGYCGLGDDMDFFYDQGKQVRTSEKRLHENLLAIKSFISKNDSLDFFLLQEVDTDSRRSYHSNQLNEFQQALPDFSKYFALNYKVDFIPQPLTNPYGKVRAGLASFSKYEARKAERHSFVGNFEWPLGVFMLDRCFLVNYFPLASGKELVLINTHNSAYDDGSLKAKQNAQLKNFLKVEQGKGNYIIVGGDWNQLPPSYNPVFENISTVTWDAIQLGKSFMPTWNFAFDNSKPSNRELNKVYTEETTHKKVIDFFLLSPNIKPIKVKGIDLDFKHSDHNPVILEVELD